MRKYRDSNANGSHHYTIWFTPLSFYAIQFSHAITIIYHYHGPQGLPRVLTPHRASCTSPTWHAPPWCSRGGRTAGHRRAPCDRLDLLISQISDVGVLCDLYTDQTSVVNASPSASSCTLWKLLCILRSSRLSLALFYI